MNMKTLAELNKEVEKLQDRNKRVEGDKAWEQSWSRRILIAVITYIAVAAFFVFAKLPDPYSNAIIPTLAYTLSTISAPKVKHWWINRQK
jgi:hypothetical protein